MNNTVNCRELYEINTKFEADKCSYTELYIETGDINIVEEALGHSSLTFTAQAYAFASDEKLRIKLLK